MLHHGGLLIESAKELDISIDKWLDISTGVSPYGYPVDRIPERYWYRLPERADGLIEAACSFYRAQNLIATAGEQQAIQSLPQAKEKPSKVAIVSPTYNEHVHNWLKFGHSVKEINPDQIIQESKLCDVIVVVNPNNPTGTIHDKNLLLEGKHSVRG